MPKFWVMLKSKIKSHYQQHSCERITQGDILRDLSIIIVNEDLTVLSLEYQYGAILSQDCDLEQGCKIPIIPPGAPTLVTEFNQFLPSILFIPAFPAELLRSGEHLVNLYQIRTKRISSEPWSIIKQNNNPRYHFLPAEPNDQVPELVMDFKAYFTIPFKTILSKYAQHYLTTVNEIFREGLSQRFANYLSRIGLPELTR